MMAAGRTDRLRVNSARTSKRHNNNARDKYFGDIEIIRVAACLGTLIFSKNGVRGVKYLSSDLKVALPQDNFIETIIGTFSHHDIRSANDDGRRANSIRHRRDNENTHNEYCYQDNDGVADHRNTAKCII